MAFVMEALTPERYEQIYREHDALISKRCIPQSKWDPSWKLRQRAIDKERDISLMLIGRLAPNDIGRLYLVTWGDAAVVFELNGDEVEPMTWPDALAAQRDEVQGAITEAFKVHGIFGLTPPQPFDIPTPKFK